MKIIILVLLFFTNIVGATEIPIIRQNGVFEVPVQLNDQFSINFIIDSGAGISQIPIDVIRPLILSNTIQESDILNDELYMLADGSTTRSKVVIIRKMQIGDVVLNNIKVAVTSSKGVLLLGQNFFQQFTHWSINNATSSLILGDQLIQPIAKQNISVTSITATAPTAPLHIVAWTKEYSNGSVVIVSDLACTYTDLIKKGYQYEASISIPINQLKNANNAYYTNESYATTVVGCWSPKYHKAFWHRKQDAKTWENLNFHVDNTWVKMIN